MNRKLATLLAAILLPGGFIALFGVILVRALCQTVRGREIVARAQKRMAALGVAPFNEQQAA